MKAVVDDKMLKQQARAIIRLILTISLVVLGLLAGYRAYRLYFVIPVLWFNNAGITMSRVTPNLETAFEYARLDIPDVSASMLGGISGRRKEIGFFSLLSLGLLGGAGYVLRRGVARREESLKQEDKAGLGL
jgi:hypothetical protein